MIEAVAPMDELEGALAVQMAYTHTAAMSVLVKMDSGFGTERRIAAFGSTAARLMKAYAMQMEVLRRQRSGGQQLVRVEHVHINDGGHAAIGNVIRPDSDLDVSFSAPAPADGNADRGGIGSQPIAVQHHDPRCCPCPNSDGTEEESDSNCGGASPGGRVGRDRGHPRPLGDP
jgi:hypothetical protein